jgi:hypothetical protein
VDSKRVMKSLVISIEIYVRIEVLPRMLSGKQKRYEIISHFTRNLFTN